jgi:hypothetical protein
MEEKKCTWCLKCKTSMSWVNGGCRWQGASNQMWGWILVTGTFVVFLATSGWWGHF